MRGRAVVAYQAHNLKVCGSIPHPATKKLRRPVWSAFFLPVKPVESKGFTTSIIFSVSPKIVIFRPKSSLILCSLKDFSKNVYLV